MADLEYKRRVEKVLTTGGQVPTVPASNDHTDGTWLITDIYEGEVCINVTDGKVYTRMGSNIVALTTLLVLGVALAGIDADITAALKVATFPAPENMSFSDIIPPFITVDLAPVGSSAIWDVNLVGSTILSTKITIEAGEFSSLDAASQPEFSVFSATKGQQMSVDCDQIGAATAGQNPVLFITYKQN